MENKQIGIAIIRVEDTKFSMVEGLFDTTKNEPFRLSFDFRVFYRLEASQIIFTLVAKCHTQDPPNPIFLEITVENGFVVENLDHYIINRFVEFPKETWAVIIGICVGHARALLAKRTKGTVYENCMIPLLNAFDLTDQFLSATKVGAWEQHA